jgi:SAM-dependent methyltransferase
MIVPDQSQDPTQRFSNRAENYRKYRPGYPPELYAYLRDKAGLAPQDIVADLGSGTGILSQVFFAQGHKVYAVEPNKAMRQAGEENFAGNPNFISINGRAEAFTLPNVSIDFVVAGQAFHWFDPPETKAEVRRILKPGKQVALIWNNRRIKHNLFQQEYEILLEKFGIDYMQVSRRWVITDEKLSDWFAPNPMTQTSFPNSKRVDAAALRGGLLSASYAPNAGHPNYEPMQAAIQELFVRHQVNGFINVEYTTKVFHGLID